MSVTAVSVIGSIAFGPLVIVIEYLAKPPGATIAVDPLICTFCLSTVITGRTSVTVTDALPSSESGRPNVSTTWPTTTSSITLPALRPV